MIRGIFRIHSSIITFAGVVFLLFISVCVVLFLFILILLYLELLFSYPFCWQVEDFVVCIVFPPFLLVDRDLHLKQMGFKFLLVMMLLLLFLTHEAYHLCWYSGEFCFARDGLLYLLMETVLYYTKNY